MKLWRVELGASRTPGGNDGAPTGATKAALLTGHKRGVWSLDFSADCSKVATASKDGTWRLYDTKEGISMGKCLGSGSSPLGEIVRIALSNDGSVIAAVVGTSIQVKTIGLTLHSPPSSAVHVQALTHSAPAPATLPWCTPVHSHRGQCGARYYCQRAPTHHHWSRLLAQWRIVGVGVR